MWSVYGPLSFKGIAYTLRQVISVAFDKASNCGKSKYSRSAVIVLIVTVAMTAWSGRLIMSSYKVEPIVPGPSVSDIVRLSHYFPGIEGTPGDTDVYFLDSGNPGGTVLVLGGVHATEVAGMLTGVLLIENAQVNQGRLIVIPHSNNSGFTAQPAEDAFVPVFHIQTEWGERWFRLGDRLTNSVHQWPDPEAYAHYPSGQILSGSEVRNLNRCFPGRPDGLFTEKIAYAITQLIEAEACDLVIDLHEASAMYPVVNVMVAHDNAIDIAGMAAMTMEFEEGVNIGVEASPVGLRGLSHREIGDHTRAKVILMETANPMMDWVRGRTTEDLLLTGQDEFMLKASKKGLVRVPYDEQGVPIEERVGRHSSGLQQILNTMSLMYPDSAVQVEGVPKYAEIREHGLGHFLKNPAEDI